MQTIRKPRESVPVWDPLIRIFHWSLAGFFLLAYVTEDEFLTVHVYAGYAVAGLIVFCRGYRAWHRNGKGHGLAE